MSKSLTIAISTYQDRIYEALNLAKRIKSNGFKVLIIHQSNNEIEKTYIPHGIEYIHIVGRGVARSRNKAIEIVKSGFLWFMDDDCEIDFDELSNLSEVLKNDFYNHGFITVQSKNENGKLRKKYFPEGYKHNLFSIHRFGTIEIIVNIESIKKEFLEGQLLFPENMGAGALYPLCDEPVFLARIIKAGKLATHVCKTPVIHKDESSGMLLNILPSKRVAFKLIHGNFLGELIFLVFLLKYRFKP